MRIALICLARRGGMVHFQADLANSMCLVAPTVAVLSSAVEGSSLARPIIKVRVDTGRNALGSAIRALNPVCWHDLYRKLQSTDADIMHIVGVHEWNPLVCILLKLQGKPVVYTVHDPEAHSGAPVAIRASNWMSVRLADALVVLTRFGRDQLIAQRLPAHKIFHIPYGISNYFTTRPQRKVRHEKRILYFGRIEPYKGLDVLLDAYVRLRKFLPDWSLTIAGVGVLPVRLLRGQAPGIQIINRYVRDLEVTRLMQRARLVVVPYLEATQSAVIATAFGFGRPVIATDVGGLKEMVIHGKNGLLVPPHDAEALADAIKSLATSPGRLLRMGRNAYALGQKKWGWARIARKHLRMYAKVTSRRRDK
jgi:glycosyltransferase involved in cell wall biosynthesis